ncbi:YqaJ viral recombinase family protein [Cupriavidus campinensis]|uniref:YqaJ viral recombinase family protein n=1 Tax=Cupriavidus campinensis TaxID=151783 RepID=A0AAE9I7D8_9BURK|nr:YqaJ viral recombinase family protein [Cupriavidus campinensis]URF05451.1 YqaJ viral recombinase family protein [Cupriavidus campinensis]
MQIHNLNQGTPEWQHFRLSYHGASEAAAMLGLSPYVKRTELLHVKHTGTPKEFSDFVQERILDRGHEVEALARPLVEDDLGEDLYPVTCSDGALSASCDGLTMAGDVAFEHKQWNEELALAVENGNVPDSHMPQCQQIMLVTGAERVRFVVSDGTRDRFVWTDVTPDEEWFDRIRAGWEQFEKDLADYLPQALEVKPVGRTPETLPALLVEVTGHVTASNLTEFRNHAVAVFRAINRNLSTDQDFADAEKTVKWCGEVESRLEAAKQHALSQTASIDALFRTIDDISAEARRVRLDLDKLVSQRKTEIKESIIRGGRDAYEKHVQALKAETGGAWVPLGMPDFAGAAKGKRSVASIQDAVDTVLANAKIDADASAKRIRANVAFLEEAIAGYEFLFADRAGLSTKHLDDLRLVVTSRIDKHKADEQRRQDAERERIRKEEQLKLEREAAEKAAADKAAAQAPAPAPAPAPAREPAAAARPASPVPRQAAPVTQMAGRPRPIPRPADAEIVSALVSHFEATEAEVIGWLCELDFSSFDNAA